MPLVNRTFDQLIDFTRTSAATFVNSSGNIASTPQSRNLLTFTNEFANAAWAKQNTTIIPNVNPAAATLGAELVTNGEFASGTTGWTDITGSWAVTGGALAGTSISASAFGPYSNGVATAGRIYLATFTITVTSGSVLVRVGNTESSAYSTGGTYSQYFVATSSAAAIFQVRAGGSGFTGTIDNVSVREVTGGALQAPDGTFTADTLIENTATNFHALSTVFTFVAGTIYTISIYAKQGSGSRALQIYPSFSPGGNGGAAFNLSNGTVVTTAGTSSGVGAITAVGNGWYRCSFTFVCQASGANTIFYGMAPSTASGLNASYAGDGVSSLLLWGAQFEQVPDANLTLGSELVTNGDFASATGWTAGAGWSIGSGVATASSSSAILSQASIFTSGKAYRISFTQTYTSGSLQVRIAGSQSLGFPSQSGTIVIYAVATATGSLEFNGTSLNTVIDNVSVREITGYTNTPTDYTRNFGGLFPPRFDYDPVTRAPRGLLIEEQRTNLLLRSEEFDNAAWTKLRSSVTANATTSPDGTVDADKLVEDTTASDTHLVAQGATLSAVSHTFTVYVKAAERSWVHLVNNSIANVSAYFNVGSGAIGTVGSAATASITNAGNGWYRCSIAFTASAGTNNMHIRLATANNTEVYTGDGTSGIFVYGAQLEAGAFATSYIPTVASQVTRTADIPAIQAPNFASWFNQSEGSLVVEGSAYAFPAASSNNAIAALSDGTTANSHYVYAFGSAGYAATQVSSVVQANPTSGSALSVNTPYKMAYGYKTNDFAFTVNGATVGTDASGTVPTVNQLQIGRVGSTILLNGWVRSIRYYPTKLSNAQLQALTA